MVWNVSDKVKLLKTSKFPHSFIFGFISDCQTRCVHSCSITFSSGRFENTWFTKHVLRSGIYIMRTLQQWVSWFYGQRMQWSFMSIEIWMEWTATASSLFSTFKLPHVWHLTSSWKLHRIVTKHVLKSGVGIMRTPKPRRIHWSILSIEIWMEWAAAAFWTKKSRLHFNVGRFH